jgi:signal transduction histidine kinase
LLSNWPIRLKLLVWGGLLLAIVATLSLSGLRSVYSYRELVRSLSPRASELPIASQLTQDVSDVRVTLSQVRGMQKVYPLIDTESLPMEGPILREQFRMNFLAVRDTVDRYRRTLDANQETDLLIGDASNERHSLAQIDKVLLRIEEANRAEDWMLDAVKAEGLSTEIDQLQQLTAELTSYLHHRIEQLPDHARIEYRALLLLTWASAIASALILLLFVRLAHRWLLGPLRVLIDGSKRIAKNDNFGHRIHLDGKGELTELAEAMNDMTARFQAVRDDLDHQVEEQTDQVVRSEQLASLGVLAAGVAHEINNPLASIAMCAESLDSRVRELLSDSDDDHQVVSSYLEMIQTEAFRCKEITERLLDFSRTSNTEHETTDLRELVGGVLDVVQHMGKHQDKQIELVKGPSVSAPVSPQEIKQVVLNLLTNALDSVDDSGRVTIELHADKSTASLVVTDNGCGMTHEVLDHLFEPFFTRKRSGQGTGLGLSIAYRIVQRHGGEIIGKSAGPDQGSQFTITLPLRQQRKETTNRYQAA